MMTCALCGDSDRLILESRCHIFAPLKAELHGTTLILRCYVPECGKEVARFDVVPSAA
jgi:hypothetical protein